MHPHAASGGVTTATADLEEIVDRYLAAGGQPGLVYGVVEHGRLVHVGSRGWRRDGGPAPDESTAFRIASMTKSFTAATVLLLRDEGLLRLDDEVSRYVPEVAALRPPTDDAPPLTVRALLTMTAGLPTDDPWGDRQQDLPDDAFADLLRGGLSFAWTPGTAYEYSNTGYALLGRVIAAAAGAPYADVVTGWLLAPLGLRSTVFTAEDVPAGHLAQGYRATPDGGWEEVPFAGHGAYAPMGGLFSTVADLARWVGGFTAAYPPRDDDGVAAVGRADGGAVDSHPLSRSARREQQQPHRALAPLTLWRSLAEPPVVRGQAYGYGLVVEHDPGHGDAVGHGGGYPGFGSHMRWHPASGLGIVALGNATYAPAGRLTAQLLDHLLAASPARRSAGRTGPAPSAGRAMTAATLAARDGVEALLRRWDDGLAGRLLAPNVDLDEPLERRRATIEAAVAQLGPLEREPVAPRSASPAHLSWWLGGPGGRLRVEIRLTPQVPPQVQTLAVTAVRFPPADVRALAEHLAAALIDAEPGWPAGWLLPDPVLDPGVEEVRRALRVAAAWSGACRVTAVTAGDGESHATFRLDPRAVHRMPLLLTLSWEPGTRRLTSLGLVPAPPEP